MRFLRKVGLAFGAMVLQTAAYGAEAPDDYETVSRALATDLSCGFLNFMEHESLQRALSDFERQAGVRPPAVAPACTGDAATAAVSAGRPAALFMLAVAAVEAGTFATSSSPLGARERDLAFALNSYLDRVLGADAPQYIDPAQNAARAAIEENEGQARARLSAVLADIAFQGAAEGAGYRVTVFAQDWIRLQPQFGASVLAGRVANCRAADAAAGSQSECYVAVKDGAVVAFFRAAPGGAAPVVEPAAVKLYVRRPEAAIRNAQGDPVARTGAWRANAVGFEGRKTSVPFLGGALYEFGPAASAAFLNQNPNDEAEIAFANTTGAVDAAGGPPANLVRLEGLIAELKSRPAR